jgi:hypothetical protein
LTVARREEPEWAPKWNTQKSKKLSEICPNSFQLIENQVKKSGRQDATVSVDEIEIQYVIIIGGSLLTYLLTGTDRLERAIVKEMDYRLLYCVIKDTKSSSRNKK